jgi:hypothetical protein
LLHLALTQRLSLDIRRFRKELVGSVDEMLALLPVDIHFESEAFPEPQALGPFFRARLFARPWYDRTRCRGPSRRFDGQVPFTSGAW